MIFHWLCVFLSLYPIKYLSLLAFFPLLIKCFDCFNSFIVHFHVGFSFIFVCSLSTVLIFLILKIFKDKINRKIGFFFIWKALESFFIFIFYELSIYLNNEVSGGVKWTSSRFVLFHCVVFLRVQTIAIIRCLIKYVNIGRKLKKNTLTTDWVIFCYLQTFYMNL